MSSSPVAQTSATGAKKSGAKKVCTRVSLEPTENGGFSVSKGYRYEKNGVAESGLGWVDDDKYAFSNKKELMAWLDKEL